MGFQVLDQQIQNFSDLSGSPLQSGYIYIGSNNQNPETNPIIVYWDSDLTQPVGQPIRTIGGYPNRNGYPSRVYVPISQGSFSITVKDKNKRVVYSKLSSDFFINDIIVSEVAAQVAIDANIAQSSASSAQLSAQQAQSSETICISSASSAQNSALVSAAFANIEWAGFSLSDGELIVTYTNGATSVPSLVDGEFIISY